MKSLTAKFQEPALSENYEWALQHMEYIAVFDLRARTVIPVRREVGWNVCLSLVDVLRWPDGPGREGEK